MIPNVIYGKIESGQFTLQQWEEVRSFAFLVQICI